MKPENISIRASGVLALIFLTNLCLTPNAHSATCCGGAELSASQSCCNDVAYEPDSDKACCNEEGIYDPSVREGDFSVGAEATDYLKSKMSDALEHIPGIGSVTISEAGVSFTKTISDCCPDQGGPVIGGSKGAQGSGTLGAEVDEFCLWPQGGITTQEWEGSLLGNTIELDVNIGVFLAIDLSTTVGLGYLDNSCDDKMCYYGSISLSTNITLDIRLEAILCTKFIFQEEEECGEVTVSPVAATCAFGVNGTYNASGDCEAGWDGSIGVGPATVSTEARIGGGQFNIDWYTWDGYFG